MLLVANFIALISFRHIGIYAQDLSKSYAPVYVDCPTDFEFVRPASQGLNPVEARWLHKRKQVVTYALADYLNRLDLRDFNIGQYIDGLYKSNYSAVPTIALAISGGGFASAYTGTGALNALDNRVDAANIAGTGGLLQSMSYFTGQSGGSWPPLSFATSNFPTAEDLLDYWQPEVNRFAATTNGTHAATEYSYFDDIADKAKAGFNVSVADLLARSTAYEFVKGPKGGLGVTLSGIVNQTKFKQWQMPMPLAQVSEVIPSDPEFLGVQTPLSNATIYEFTPLEFGSWFGSAKAFTPSEYLGTRLRNGKPLNASVCVKGFDSAGFVMGTEENAFEFWYLGDSTNGTLGQFPKRSYPPDLPAVQHDRNRRAITFDTFPEATVNELIEGFNESFGLNLTQMYPSIYPNPFLEYPTTSPAIKAEADLKLVDATELGSSLPLLGLVIRNASFIMAWDANGDAFPYGWLNGTNLYNAYQYMKSLNLAFPVVPNPTTFIAKNYTYRPAFFGCNTSLTTTGDTRAPIVAWFPAAPYSSYVNMSFAQSNTTIPRVRDLWTNSFNTMTQGNNTIDKEWTSCLACAAIDRSLDAIGMSRTEQCKGCFERWCWDGVEVEAGGHEVVDLGLALKPEVSYAKWWNETGKALQVPFDGFS